MSQQSHKESSRRYMQKYAARIRRAVIAFLGDRCIICGFSDWRALQIDHIKGGGSALRRKGKHKERGVAYHKRILDGKYGKPVQLLCANCNWIKRYEQMEHS